MPEARGQGAGSGGMSRAEWLTVVMREANGVCKGPGDAADPVELERRAADAAARAIAGAADPIDFVRHSGLREPEEQTWREAGSWSDALVAVACACLGHDIAEHAGRIAAGTVPHLDPEKIV